MPRSKIYFSDLEIDLLSQRTGLSKLELSGVIAEMNKFTYSEEALKKWNHDEMMGRNI